jgi:hypothetical protein
VHPPDAATNLSICRFAGYGDNFSVKRAGLPDLSSLPSERGQQVKGARAARAATGPPGEGGQGSQGSSHRAAR